MNTFFIQVLLGFPDIVLSSTPKQLYFGEFVTIYRQKKHIHGCMGWWNHSFQHLSYHELSLHLRQSFHDALVVDQRSRFFSGDVFLDPTTILQLQFLRLPIRSSPFVLRKNEGLLLHEKNGFRRATFLPFVFPPGTLFPVILDKLVQKAGHPLLYSTFTYKTTSLQFPFQTFDKVSLPFLLLCVQYQTSSIVDFILKYGHMPYSFLPNGNILCDESQVVRNLSAVLYVKRHVAPQVWRQCRKKLSHMFDRVPQSLHGQLYYDTICIHNKKQRTRVMKEMMTLSEIQQDVEFALPQSIVLAGFIDSSFQEPVVISSIFAWNWWTQANVLVIHSQKLGDVLHSFIVEWDSKFGNRMDTCETNELVVALEGSCCLPPTPQNTRRIFMCLYALGPRMKSRETPFFSFIYHDSARLDISIHFMCAIYFLQRRLDFT